MCRRKRWSLSDDLVPEVSTAQQRLFVRDYLNDFNGIMAAIRTGYARRTALSITSENLTKPDIQNALARAVEERYAQAEGDATLLLLQLVEEINADIADLFNDDGGLKPMDEWPAVWQRARGQCRGGGLSSRQDGFPQRRICRITFSDRLRRLELIGCHVDVARLPEQGLAGSRAPIGIFRQADCRQTDEAA